jgi:hypothetical protein
MKNTIAIFGYGESISSRCQKNVGVGAITFNSSPLNGIVKRSLALMIGLIHQLWISCEDHLQGRLNRLSQRRVKELYPII